MPIPDDMARLILTQGSGVLSTSADDVPHASLMSYAPEPDLTYIHMATPASTRKWANLGRNPRLALLVDDRCETRGGTAPTSALTVGGTHVPVQDPQEKRRILDMLIARHPHLADFLSQKGMELIRLKPSWMLHLSGPDRINFIDLQKK